MESDAGSGAFWFPVVAGDFLAETAGLSNSSLACLVLMRCYLVKRGRLPSNKKEIERICRGAKAQAIAPALKLLKKDESGYYCPMVEAAKNKAEKTQKARSDAGRAGAAERWKNEKRETQS